VVGDDLLLSMTVGNLVSNKNFLGWTFGRQFL